MKVAFSVFYLTLSLVFPFFFTAQVSDQLKVERLNGEMSIDGRIDEPARTGGEELIAGSDHSWRTYEVSFNTDTRQLMSLEGEVTVGGFYNGKRVNLSGQLNYRYQSYGSIALMVDYNDINLPWPFRDAEFWLIGPRIDLTFTDKLFLTTFVQYNEQQDNINLNARFQWRYKPVSDIFVVYTDNYFPEQLQVKDRALVFKITYWLNI